MAKTITFKKDADLDRIDRLLSRKRMQNKMPVKVRGKRAPMTLWAIEELTRTINGNGNSHQDEEAVDDSGKWQAMMAENEKLKTELQQLIEQNGQLKEKVQEQKTTIWNLNEENKELEEQVRKYDEQETWYVEKLNYYMKLNRSNYLREKDVKENYDEKAKKK